MFVASFLTADRLDPSDVGTRDSAERAGWLYRVEMRRVKWNNLFSLLSFGAGESGGSERFGKSGMEERCKLFLPLINRPK